VLINESGWLVVARWLFARVHRDARSRTVDEVARTMADVTCGRGVEDNPGTSGACEAHN
jgi:hypothetical protein